MAHAWCAERFGEHVTEMGSENAPNILWYCTDQQRFDTIAALGSPQAHTPTLDGLVAEGVSFSHAYCQNPICAPSRASFMTGRYPSAVGVTANGNDYFPPEAEATLVSRQLADAGYDCGLVGKLHLAGCERRREPRTADGFRFFQWSHSSRDNWPPGEHDYADWLRTRGHDPAAVLKLKHERKDRVIRPSPDDDNVPPELHQTTWCSEMALEFLAGAREPWLLCVNPFDPHPPFNPPWEYWRRFDIEDMPGAHFRPGDLQFQARLAAAGVDFQRPAVHPEVIDVRALQAAYYAMIELVDDQFGRLLRWLDASGQRENTLVLFTSDHGEMLGDHGLVQKGCRFYEGAVRVPLIWSWPSRLEAGVRSQALVELTDIAPTLLELAGRSVPERMQGKSLLPILTGVAAPDEQRTFVRSEYRDSSSGPHQTQATMYRDRRWKLITYHSHGVGELYDLASDPWEHHDLWNDPGHADVRHELTQRSFDASMLALDSGPPRTMRH